jgi:tetratricopeptide (TPR) repeat protein
VPPPAAAPAPAAPPPAPAPAAAPAAPPPPAAAAAPADAAAAPPPVAAAPAPEPPPAPEAAKPPEKPPVAEKAEKHEKPASEKPAEPAADSKPKTYERLVADADHALENGQTAKAQKLYDDALRQQPNGVAAMTGSAYVLMDKRRPLAAIGLFKQALSYAPHYAPALFGLGEAYRAQGDAAQAVEAYKSYLEQSPTGTDAPAARRQIKELGEAAASPRNQGPSATVPENAPTAN